MKPTINALEAIVLKNKSTNPDISLFKIVRSAFLSAFKETDDDVVVIYARAISNHKVKTISFKVYSDEFLTAIQKTTAGSAVAILFMMLNDQLKDGVNSHSDIDVNVFFDSPFIKKIFNNNF